MWKRKIAGLVFLLLLLPFSTVQAAEAGPFQCILSWTGDTGTTMTVSWRDSTTGGEVLQTVSAPRYDKSGFTDAQTFPADSKSLGSGSDNIWRYEATAEGLSPGVEYVYRVGNSGGWSDAKRFTTADPGAPSLTFAYLGDIQTADDTERENALWGELAQSMARKNPDLAFAVLGGDIVESGIRPALFDSFFKNASPVFSQIPLMAANGNHESNFPGGKPELYLQEFALPTNGPNGFTEEFYSFDDANCHILVLNSWIFSGEQALTAADIQRVNDWIKNDLAHSTADWQIVVTHVPVYPVHSDATADRVRANWAPIFEKYGVDLVFEGHQHVYSRSFPLKQGAIDFADGVTYIMGNSGQKFYSDADETLAARTIYNTATYQLVHADEDTLHVGTYELGGDELDDVTLHNRPISATRGEYVETLWRGVGSPAPGGASPFPDAKTPAAAWAYQTGLIRGYDNRKFGFGDTITARQIGLILGRMGGAA